jgi:hypothetical protein
VGAVCVVVERVLVEVLGEGGHLRDKCPGVGGAPAFLEDGRVDAFDAAVAVRAVGADEALAGPELRDRLAEVLGAELRPVVRGDFLQRPAGGGELCGDAMPQLARVA